MKSKILIIFYVLVAVTISFLAFMSFKTISSEIDYDKVKNEVYNVSNMPPYPANTIFNDYAFYFPTDYRKVYSNDSLMFVSNNSTFVINFGFNEKINPEFLKTKNPTAKKEFEFINASKNDIQYFIVWDREDSESSLIDYKDILIGTNDRFIEGTVPVEELEKYSVDSAYILKSIKQIKKEETK